MSSRMVSSAQTEATKAKVNTRSVFMILVAKIFQVSLPPTTYLEKTKTKKVMVCAKRLGPAVEHREFVWTVTRHWSPF